MRHLLIFGTAVLLTGCAMDPPAAPIVSWEYGAGNGDGVPYAGPPPVFNHAYGLSDSDDLKSSQTATTQYGYGADGQPATMVHMAPDAPPTQVVAPAPVQGKAVTSNHS